MQRYILKRLIQGLVVIWLVGLVVFMLTRITGDPVLLMMPPEASKEDYEIMRHQLGLDKPVYAQYWDFMAKAVRGDFGRSIRWNEPTFSLFFHRFPATLQLAVAAFLLAVLIGIPVGILSAVRPNGFFDRFGKVFAILGQSLPTFWTGIMFILLFSVTWRLLPTSGKGSIEQLVMPAVSLGWYFMAAQVRLSRSAMLDVLDSEYIKMARIKGLPERLVILKHGFKNAMLPVLTMASMNFVVLLQGTVITEVIFAWPGIGRLTVDALFARDFPVVQTNILITSTLFVVTNLVVDISYAYLDPRIRYQ